jgi:hypothetical protein
MTEMKQAQYTAFEGPRRIAAGDITQVALAVKKHFKDDTVAGVLIFEDAGCHLVDIDFSGTADDVVKRIALTAGKQDIGKQDVANEPIEPEPDAPRGPGRPKLGVVAREVTLLPRHWDWLNTQTGGASVALRKLVEEARRASAGRDRIRLAQEASYRFMTAATGNEANFEEVARALFAGNRTRFNELVEPWPADLRDYLKRLTDPAFLDASDGEEK